MVLLAKSKFFPILIFSVFLNACSKELSTVDILEQTIASIDTIERIYYKQDMTRTNPRDVNETIFRYREMYFERLKQDSLVGVKGHWFFYDDQKKKIKSEDIYDGKNLIRKNNLDSTIRYYNLIKYPEFLQQPFWGHNTPFAMQYSLKYILDHQDIYKLESLKDTIINQHDCYQLAIHLKDYTTMPGFATNLEKSTGSISTEIFFISKETFYPVSMRGESAMATEPEIKFFIDQLYYDIKINEDLSEKDLFDTSLSAYSNFEIIEMKP